jgi:hypothetical protein
MKVETSLEARQECRILDGSGSASYGRLTLGAFVPVAELDFGCGDLMFGGELACKKAKLDPVRETCELIANRAELGPNPKNRGRG